MASPIKVRRVGSDIYKTDEYSIIPIYFLGKRNGKSVTTVTAPREVYIVNNLKAKLLVGIDIIVPEKIDIVVLKLTASIGSYIVEIPIKVRTRGRPVTYIVYAKNTIIVPPYS